MASYLIGTDIGTTGTKSCVMNEEGKVLASHYIEFNLLTPRAGWAEHDPADYVSSTIDTIRAVMAKSGIDKDEVKGMSISAFSPGCILVDKDGNAMQNSHIWMDRRGIKQSEWLKEHIGADRAFEVSGNPIDPYYCLIKLMWERDNRPELYRKAWKFLNPSNYLVLKFTGKATMDYSNAGLVGVVFDLRAKKWDAATIEEIGLNPDLFPDLYPCDAVVGGLTGEAAELLGLNRDTPVMAGGVDAMEAYVANGALDDGDWSLTMGTAGCMGVIHNDPNFARNLLELPAAANSETAYGSVGATIAFGSCLRYYRDEFAQYEKSICKDLGLNVYDMLNMEAATVGPGSEGLIVIPYFSGERTPIWDPNARALVFGMSLKHTKYHFLRALMEGAVLALYDNYCFMKEAGINIKEPIMVGEGGARSALWRQILADVFGVQVAYQREQKGAPEGNAICAGVATGVFKDYRVAKEWAKFTDFNEPDQKNHELYMQMFGVYKELYNGVKSQYDVMAGMF